MEYKLLIFLPINFLAFFKRRVFYIFVFCIFLANIR